MKGLLAIGAAVIVLGAASASTYAADARRKLPVKAPPAAVVPAPAFTWTGCYIGGQLGGGWGHKYFSKPTGFELATAGPVLRSTAPIDNFASGLLGGGEAGCRYQFPSRWVIGLEGDFAGAKIFSSRNLNVHVPGLLAPATYQTQANWLASATGSLGYAFDRLLLYGKGGVAWVRDTYGFSIAPIESPPPGDFRGSETRSGWTWGAGLEYLFSKNFSAKIEYDFYQFGNRNVSFTNQLPSTVSLVGNADIDQKIHVIKFGVNYYFWNPAPLTSPPPPLVLVTKSPAAASAVPAAVSSDAIAWTQTFASEVRYFSWRGTRGIPSNQTTLGPPFGPLTSAGSGSEIYTPYASQLVGQTNDFKIELLGRGGWVDARQTTAGLTGQVQTATDTVASATITYLGVNGVQPFATVEMNLPTGLASLPPTAVNARMDPDLVDIASFGEGFNIGPTLGFNLPLTSSFLVTLSAGYTHRGTFERETPLTPTDSGPGGSTKIDPGDVLTGTVSVGYQVGQLTTKLTGTISYDTTATLENGMPFVRPGRTYLAAGTWTYAWPGDNVGVTTLSASASHANRNEVLFVFAGAPSALVKEPLDTNSNLYRVGLEHLFAFGQIALGPTGSFLLRDANGYDPTTIQFVPQKTRWAAGMQAKYAASNTLVFNARVDRVWVHENESPALPNGVEKTSVFLGGALPAFTVPVISSTGWQFMLGANASF
jgi:opacity protein-like surface antigen